MHRLPHLRIEIASVAGEMCISGQQTCRQLHTSTLVAHYAAATVVLIIYAIIHCSEANITTHSSSDAGNTSSLLNHSIVQGMFDKLKMQNIHKKKIKLIFVDFSKYPKEHLTEYLILKISFLEPEDNTENPTQKSNRNFLYYSTLKFNFFLRY